MSTSQTQTTKTLDDVKQDDVKQDELVAAPPGGILNAEPMDFSAQGIRALFLGDAKFEEHSKACQADPKVYVRQLHTMVERKLASLFSVSIKGRILAAVVVAKEYRAVDFLLRVPSLYGVAEVLKAAQLLDAPRQVRQLNKKVEKLEALKRRDEKRVRSKTIQTLRTHIHNTKQEFIEHASLPGSVVKRLRRWCRTIPADSLEFFLMNFPPNSWKSLADLLHLKASDFSLPYFLDVIYGGEEKAPADSLMKVAARVTKHNITDILKEHPRLVNCYSFLRRQLKDDSEATKELQKKIMAVCDMGFTTHQATVGCNSMRYGDVQNIVEWILENDARIIATPVAAKEQLMPTAALRFLAARAPLEDLLWFYEELESADVEESIHQRLSAGESIVPVHSRSNYGKLMERLLTFRQMRTKFAPLLLPYAEEKLNEIHVPLMDKINVAVLGDASGSMEVAIRTATTLGSLLSVALNADLSFFNEQAFPPPCIPRSAQEVVKVVESVPALGGTSMAAALWPYYSERKSVDLFVLVSDEGENRQHQGLWFAELFKKYKEEVNPSAKVFLVSFLPVGTPGKIADHMKQHKLECRQFRLDPQRPDTSKFDALLGMISLETTELKARWETVSKVTEDTGIGAVAVDLIMGY